MKHAMKLMHVNWYKRITGKVLSLNIYNTINTYLKNITSVHLSICQWEFLTNDIGFERLTIFWIIGSDIIIILYISEIPMMSDSVGW